MGLVGRIVRPAIEQAVRLVRDSSDWNPPLKSAAGGVTCILEQTRVRAALFVAKCNLIIDDRMIIAL